MKLNFVVLSHDEPEIFRCLEQLEGQDVFVIDDWSERSHYEHVKWSSTRPTVIRRSLEKDFAAQRNFIHQFIPRSEWVITIDADEIVEDFEMFLREIQVVKAEAFRMKRFNVTLHTDGTKTVVEETHIRGWCNLPHISWVGTLHELPTGFVSEEMLPTATLLHAKTKQRCEAQDRFYKTFL